MKKTFQAVVLATSGFIGAGSLAQEPQDAGTSAPHGTEIQISEEKGKQGNTITPFNKATTLLGSAVHNLKGEPIGKLQDVVFDVEKAELGYFVLALESAGKSRIVAVPMRALKPSGKHLVLNISEPILAAAEGLREGGWPAMDIFAVGSPAGPEVGSDSSDVAE